MFGVSFSINKVPINSELFAVLEHTSNPVFSNRFALGSVKVLPSTTSFTGMPAMSVSSLS